MFSRKTKFFAAVFSLFFLFSLILAYINGVVKPILYAKSEARMKMYIEESISKALSDADSTIFPNSINFNYNADGSISAYSADMLSVAKLRAYISDKLITPLGQELSVDFRINIGSLSGVSFLYGRGPVVTIHLTGLTFANFNVASEFSDCGINQTLHRLILKVEAVSTLKEPLGGRHFKVTTDIPISETVLIGDVPDAYTLIIRAAEEDEADINDYSATVD